MPERSAPPRADRRREQARPAGPASDRPRAVGSGRRLLRAPRSLGSALLATAAATIVPGTGHLMLRHRRTGGLILTLFLLATVTLGAVAATAGRTALVQSLLSARTLTIASISLVLAAGVWVAVIARTYLLARPRGLDRGRQIVGGTIVVALCLTVAGPLVYTANLANAQRNLLDNVFADGSGTSVAEAINKPRLNILLIGSDAGPDRIGARTDTMMVASIDTATARTTLFALPRNIGYARFPPATPMGTRFPEGFHDPAGNATSGDYLLNAVYAYGLANPDVAPGRPTGNAGLNLLQQTVAYMLGVQLDYFVEVNMSGFAGLIDALGGVTLDVGPEPLPIGGVLPDGRRVAPDGYVPAGVQNLNGDQALWFARSRRDSDDYSRMGRQRCLLQAILAQKGPTDVLARFEAIVAATTGSVATNIPQEVLPSLATLFGGKAVTLDSVAFDPRLPNPDEPDGRFDTGRADVVFMRQVVQDAIALTPPAALDDPTPAAGAPPTSTSGAVATPSPSSVGCA